MKLTLRPEWRLWPLASFFGLLDLKTGVIVALLFALLNKVAGVYGLVAVLTGAGGTFAQLSLYIYSVLALIALTWGLKAVKEEDPKHTLYFAHLFFADHILSTAWTVFFAVVWWVYTPHDGRRQANSAAQKEMMEGGPAGHVLTEEERERAAMAIWNHEKGTAAAIIIVSWLFKIYFALLIYSYASHLRKGSYRSLPLTRQSAPQSAANYAYESALGLPEEEEEETQDFYRVPLRTHKSTNSTSSFADFVSAPGRARRAKASPLQFSSKPNPRNAEYGIPEDETLFDEDELTYGGSSRDEEQGKLDSDSSGRSGMVRD
ncbi:DUF1753-domain-containing protein [Pluteus cervinus]|uniref:DUF1753-domain-containing protein n=1 Tax=Pluteus cervinus TaxID=181527 RepID=A0ACD3BAR4_9AGAR|nr:DUF1753-domain-containing protein [Pluteus cervinus]